MSAAPGPAAASPPAAAGGGGEAPVSTAGESFKKCWSCRALSGGGLLLAAAYVYSGARRTMRYGGPTTMGTVAQITFAASLAAFGLVVITDPVGKSHRKT